MVQKMSEGKKMELFLLHSVLSPSSQHGQLKRLVVLVYPDSGCRPAGLGPFSETLKQIHLLITMIILE